MTARWEQIGISVLTGDATSIVLATPDIFRKFRIEMYVVRGANAARPQIRLNGDTGTNYVRQYLQAGSPNGSSVTGARSTGQTKWEPANAIDANAVGMFVAAISKPVAGKVARLTSGFALIDSSNIMLEHVVGEWTNTSALITQFTLLFNSENAAAGTRIVLYGARDI